jgi:hypothetical protein
MEGWQEDVLVVHGRVSFRHIPSPFFILLTQSSKVLVMGVLIAKL